MGIPVLILGESGSGKSASMRNFEPTDVSIFNVASKPLPFRKRLPVKNNATYQTIYECRDLYLGGKKVFYNKELLQPVSGMDGQLHLIAPDSIRQQLFVQTSGDPDKDDWHEYNPDLRVSANSQAVQDALDYYSFKVGLGTHHYQFGSNGSIATATQYIGDRQDMVQHANRHQIQIEAALLTFFRTLLWAGKTILGQPVNPDAQLTINFDDSYISATGRQQDKDDCLSGFLPKYRYNMEWRGMSEEDARAAVQEAAEEGMSDSDLLFGGS